MGYLKLLTIVLAQRVAAEPLVAPLFDLPRIHARPSYTKNTTTTTTTNDEGHRGDIYKEGASSSSPFSPASTINRRQTGLYPDVGGGEGSPSYSPPGTPGGPFTNPLLPQVINERAWPDMSPLPEVARPCFEAAYQISSARKAAFFDQQPGESVCEGNVGNIFGRTAKCVSQSVHQGHASIREALVATFKGITNLCDQAGWDALWELDEFLEAANVVDFNEFFRVQ
ncbi:hypothetical protein F4778DRAFT_127440 [Xylariomycetidae sp. FL2044]|nr:hypothetical protein F4778DRAFT_127440 [Xylariomycetidae sp. FL2044]